MATLDPLIWSDFVSQLAVVVVALQGAQVAVAAEPLHGADVPVGPLQRLGDGRVPQPVRAYRSQPGLGPQPPHDGVHPRPRQPAAAPGARRWGPPADPAGGPVPLPARPQLVSSGPGGGPRTASQAASASRVGPGRVSRTFWVRPLPSTSAVPASRSRSPTSRPTASAR